MIRLSAICVLLFCGCDSVTPRATCPPPAPAPTSLPPPDRTGRFKIEQLGPLERNTFLVDTTTGDTWIRCNDDGTPTWCVMERSLATAKSTDTTKP